jgi:hypothetical protein
MEGQKEPNYAGQEPNTVGQNEPTRPNGLEEPD